MIIRRSANWRLYWGAMPLPAGARAFGTVSRGNKTGALIRLASGVYGQGNEGGIRALPQASVKRLEDLFGGSVKAAKEEK